MPAFGLQFPAREIEALAGRFPHFDETRLLALGAAAGARGHYTREEFVEVWQHSKERGPGVRQPVR
jgi:hypothetical protein